MPPGSSTQVKRPPSGLLCLVPAGKYRSMLWSITSRRLRYRSQIIWWWAG